MVSESGEWKVLNGKTYPPIFLNSKKKVHEYSSNKL